MLLIGDLHGTREIPEFVGRLLATVSSREPVALLLEIPSDENPAIHAYLAGAGGAPARNQLVARPWWQDRFQDGRRSVAMADLLETARALRAAGRRIEVVAFDAGEEDREDREEVMARNVIAARRAHPEAALIVYAGNLHTSLREAPFRPGFEWMAMRVAKAGIAFVSLNARWPDGTAWICPDDVAEHCGVSFLAGKDTVDSGIRLEPSPDGRYHGWFGLPSATASPPAGIPAMASGLEAKIAAAASSPRAVLAKARRAYDSKQYDQCADLLAQITTPDAGTAYDHACCLALVGRRDDAFVMLHHAIEAGFKDLAHLEADDDLASLRDDPRWPIKK
jgi:hypothetical protein